MSKYLLLLILIPITIYIRHKFLLSKERKKFKTKLEELQKKEVKEYDNFDIKFNEKMGEVKSKLRNIENLLKSN